MDVTTAAPILISPRKTNPFYLLTKILFPAKLFIWKPKNPFVNLVSIKQATIMLRTLELAVILSAVVANMSGVMNVEKIVLDAI
jgi:hypothetical protein